jgi:hypothetical protein
MGSAVFPDRLGPANSDIAAAVAAPSSATIASAVAAAVPTISAINSSVASNASPYGGTWTQIASGNFSGSTVSITGISAKKIKVFWNNMGTTTNATLYFRLNNDSGTNYSSYGGQITTNTGSPYSEFSSIAASMHGNLETSSSNLSSGMIEVFDAASTGVWKSYTIDGGFCQNNSTSWVKNLLGHYRSTSAITSFQFSISGGTFNQGSYAVFGVN